MEKIILLAGVLMQLSSFAFSQTFEVEGTFRKGSAETKDMLRSSFHHTQIGSSNLIAKPFDVLHYALDARLRMVDSSFSGTMTIHSLITQPTDTLWFHSVGLLFDTVRVNGVPAAYRFYPSLERFSVYLPYIFTPGETVVVYIRYSRDLAYIRFEDRQGYYCYRPSWQPGFVLENIGYTMSEPYDARLWMPCFDDPSDKATCEINATVPFGYNVASNGQLIGVLNNPDSTTTFRWRSEYPITTYLMVITASRYSTFSHYYRKVTNPSDSIEVKYYCWRQDSAGSQFNTVQAVSKVTRMMECFARIFGEYPFEKYGVAVVYPFMFGGMEHQTMTSVHRAWISVANYPFYEDGFAHELAHEWWGNMITCQRFADIWLNEGFASYSEALWREREYGRTSYEQKMRGFLVFNSSWQGAIYDPESQGMPVFNSSVYHKAAWVLHMLRWLTGDTVFFNILSNYRTAYEYSTATTTNLQNIVSTTTGENYDWFFNQWIYGRGWPKYAYTTSWNPLSNTYAVTVNQMQDTLWQTFRMPVELKIFSGGFGTSFFVLDSLRTQTFTFTFPSQPDSLQFDPQNRILKQIVSPPTEVVEGDGVPKEFLLHQNYPNPFNPSTKIGFKIQVSSFTSLKVFDVLGREVANLVNGKIDAGTYEVEFDGTNYPSGLYFYRLTTPQFTQVRKMILLK